MEACRVRGHSAFVLDRRLAATWPIGFVRHGVSSMLKGYPLCSVARGWVSPQLHMLTRRLRKGSSQAIGKPDGDNSGSDGCKARVVREHERI